jgi:pimeloyl-ACP methyl ester carboxylesterase
MTTARDHDLQLADGRVLRYQIAGTAHGDAVFLLHGVLGSRLVHNSLSAAASDAGIRLVSYDRPGYGGSTPAAGPHRRRGRRRGGRTASAIPGTSVGLVCWHG